MADIICTKDAPWDRVTRPERGKGRIVHPDAEEVPDSHRGGWPAGDTITVKCPHCGTSWTEELPQ